MATALERIQGKNTEQIREMALHKDMVLVSPDGLTGLDRAIDAVREEANRAKVRLGEAAADDPDLPHNPYFAEEKTKIQSELQARFDALRILRLNAIEYQESDPLKIGLGSRVALKIHYSGDEEGEEDVEAILLGPIEANYLKQEFAPARIISYLSPLGRSLWGKPMAAGTTGEIATPSGITTYVIKDKSVMEKTAEGEKVH